MVAYWIRSASLGLGEVLARNPAKAGQTHDLMTLNPTKLEAPRLQSVRGYVMWRRPLQNIDNPT